MFTSLKNFRDDLTAHPPDHFVCVPLVLDTLYNKVGMSRGQCTMSTMSTTSTISTISTTTTISITRCQQQACATCFGAAQFVTLCDSL